MAPKGHSHDHSHDHAQIQSKRGAYPEFVDELFRLGLVDAEKREFLHRGLASAGVGASMPASAGMGTSRMPTSSPQATQAAIATSSQVGTPSPVFMLRTSP